MHITTSPRWTATAFRLLFSLIFLVAGANHIVSSDHVARRLERAPFGFLATSLASPDALVILTGIGLLAGGTALFVGYRVRQASMILLAILVPITATAQVGAADIGPLFKNIALFGGLLHFAMTEVLDPTAARSIVPATDTGAPL